MIHQFKINGTNMVLDVNSGAVHILDPEAAKVLSCYDNDGMPVNEKMELLEKAYGNEQINEIRSELEELISEGLLFADNPYEDMFTDVKGSTMVKALCLHIAHDCNLRCKYCFAGEGDYNGEKSVMPVEVAKKAIDFVIANSGNRKNIEIDFFGGEPLLNMETVKETVRYAREKEQIHNKCFRFTITTNGILLNDETNDYLNSTMDNIVLSLDGRKEVNDTMRVRRDGTGTYETILPKFKKLVSTRKAKDYYVRGTFTSNNLDFSNDVIHMADLGFEQLSIEPVVQKDGSGIEIKTEHLEKIFSEYEKLAKMLLERKRANKGVNFFHFMIDLDGGPCIVKRLRGCGSGSEYLAVTPAGELFPCHQFVGFQEFKMGNVFTGIDRPDIIDKFKKINVYTREKCRECWARFYCSGGCTANAWQFKKDLSGVYEIGCEIQKKRIECALWLKANENSE
ncbi:MAG: thioether cross-link-forming SCIFF peptide maturase [Ruminiclostridium sp.]|nr:thioether cross-link-forming SCIFF peptide maturase [Ruminiclostridium sp.]